MNTKIPENILTKWQNIADLISELINVPAALIMHVEHEYMEVSVSSQTEDNPYNVGDREKWHGLYCKTVIESQQELLIPNALKDEKWDKNPDIKLGMIAYLGYPINYPDKTPFGTICVLDTKENNFTDLNSNILLQFREVIENDLMQFLTFDISAKKHCKTIHEQHQQLKDTNRSLEDKIKKLSAKEREIKLATKKLEDNEMKLHAILDHHFQLTGMLDSKGRLLVINKTALELIKLGEQDVIGQYFWDCPWWDGSEKTELRSAIERAAKGEFVRFETTHINAVGEVRDIDFSLSPVEDNEGKIAYIVPEGRDITEKKRVEEALHISEEKFFKVFNNSPLPFSVTVLPGGTHIDVNPAWEKASGFTKDEAIGKTTQQLGFFVNPDDENRALQKLEEEGRLNDFEVLFQTKRGDVRLCRMFSEIIEIQNQSYLLSIIYDDTDRKKAEQAELESKKRYEELVEMLPEVVFETDKDFNLIYINQRAFDLFGYSGEDMSKGINGFDIIAPIDRDRAKENIAIRESGIDPGTLEYQAIRKDGTTFPILIHASSILKNGKLDGIFGIIVDISERKKTEFEFIENEKKYRTLFESANDGILIIKGNKIVECNSKGLSIFGFDDKNEILGLTPTDLSPEKQPDGRYTKTHETENLLNVAKGKPQRFTWRHNRKDGAIVDTEVSLNPIVLRNELHIQAIIRDITERIKAEQKLQESEARFKSLFEDLGDAVYVTVLGGKNIGKVLEANKAAVRQTGYTRNELLNMNIIEDLYVQGTGKLSTEEWEAKIEEGKLITSVERKRRKDGTKYWTEVLITPIIFKGEKACLSVNRDITKRVKAEQDLKKALQKATESDRLKSAFLASMSHEIRTPLNAIIGFSNLIADSVKDAELAKYSSLINKQNDLLLKLVNDILEFAKLESGTLNIKNEVFDLNTLIDELHFTLYSELQQDTELIPQKKSESLIINSDQYRIKQVFTNLIINALKFTDKGKVIFGYEQQDKSEIKLFVKDTGIGIPQDQHIRIFERFVKLDSFSQGTGLGLSISQNIIKILGGKIWVESEPEKGSVFYFTIPIKNEDEENIFVESIGRNFNSIADLSNGGKLRTILVAEDNIVNYLYVKKILETLSLIILHATNGIEALEQVKKNDKIDLILMDIKMPVMNGYEATREIKLLKPQLPIIALTAYAQPEDELKAKSAGCNDYISKPISKEELIALIYKYFKK